MRALRHVDPSRRHGPLWRLYVRLVGSRLGMWLSPRVVWRLDPALMRLSRGRVKLGLLLPTALLETHGARSGELRRNGVIYFHDGEDVIVIASKLGEPRHPSWYFNARADPDVRLDGWAFRAEPVEDEAARERLWRLADRVFPPFASYRDRAAAAGRVIPILRLVASG